MTVTNEESGNQIVTSGHVLEPRKDPKTGKVYWTNHTLQKTVWKPQGCTPVQTSASPGAPQGGGSMLRWDIIIIITVTQVTQRSTRGIREPTTHTAQMACASLWLWIVRPAGLRTGTRRPTLRTTETRQLSNCYGKDSWCRMGWETEPSCSGSQSLGRARTSSP